MLWCISCTGNPLFSLHLHFGNRITSLIISHLHSFLSPSHATFSGDDEDFSLITNYIVSILKGNNGGEVGLFVCYYMKAKALVNLYDRIG